MSAPPGLGGQSSLSIRLPVTFPHNTFPKALTSTRKFLLHDDLRLDTLSPERGKPFLLYFLNDKKYASVIPSQLKHLSTYKFIHFSLPPSALDSLGKWVL